MFISLNIQTLCIRARLKARSINLEKTKNKKPGLGIILKFKFDSKRKKRTSNVIHFLIPQKYSKKILDIQSFMSNLLKQTLKYQ